MYNSWIYLDMFGKMLLAEQMLVGFTSCEMFNFWCTFTLLVLTRSLFFKNKLQARLLYTVFSEQDQYKTTLSMSIVSCLTTMLVLVGLHGSSTQLLYHFETVTFYIQDTFVSQ